MKTWTGSLEIEPAGKGRPTVTRTGIAFTPAKTRNKEAEVRYWLKQLDAPHFGDDPLEVSLVFYFIKPKSAKKRIYPTVKPDVDNVIKLILDSSNGILFNDDKQVVVCNARKVYGEPARVDITIRSLD